MLYTAASTQGMLTHGTPEELLRFHLGGEGGHECLSFKIRPSAKPSVLVGNLV